MNVLKRMKKFVGDYVRYSDKLLLLLCFLASGYGIVLVYSAAYTAQVGMSGVIMQIAASALGILAALIISRIDYETICAFWPVYAGVALILMILTFTSLGLNVAGTDDTAWLGIELGSRTLTFQPAELMKIVFIITFSKHLSVVREHINRPLTVLLLCLHAAFPAGLVFLQGDDGTALVFLFMFAAMMFAAGLKPIYFLIAGLLVCAAVPIIWNTLLSDPAKRNRFLCLVFVDEYRQTTGWQQYVALMSMGSGQLWGVGFLNGGKHGLYLFARNNDMIFTVAGEEFGFIGAIALILIILFMVIKMLSNAMHARDRLGMFICIGMLSLVGFQSAINIGMNVRLLPVIGITLPFFSAGGSSVATLYLGIGRVLSVYYSSRTNTQEAIFAKRL